MKREIANFVARCSNSQQVKVDQQGLGGLPRDIDISNWKWEDVNMDFVVGLPQTRRLHESIWIIMDRLTKLSGFLPIKVSYSAEEYARLYVKEIIKFHGGPLSIISDREAPFTLNFWRSYQNGLDTQVKHSTAFHPQTYGQADRTIQTLEDMLRACVFDFKGKWNDYLPLIEFTYNNNYHSSIAMAPFEALYGRGVDPRLDGLKWVSSLFLVLK